MRHQTLQVAAEALPRLLDANRADRAWPGRPSPRCGQAARFAGRRPKAFETIWPLHDSGPRLLLPSCVRHGLLSVGHSAGHGPQGSVAERDAQDRRDRVSSQCHPGRDPEGGQQGCGKSDRFCRSSTRWLTRWTILEFDTSDWAITMRNEFTAVIERDGEWHVAYCPEIPGANGQGKSKDEARESLADAIALILEDRREDGLRGVPQEAIRETVTIR